MRPGALSTEFVVFAALLFGSAALIAHACTGCTPAQQQSAAHAMTVAEYTAELDRCIQLGKVNDSLRVYQACARSVDLRLCNERGLMCSTFTDGGADAQ